MKRAMMIIGAIAVVVLGFLVLGGDDKKYTVELKLANAGGLKPGSPVVIGGVPVGKVDLDASFKEVTVELKIDDKYAPFGKDATANVVSQNLLGQKQVNIDPGKVEDDPAPDGFVIPTSAVAKATDLDQLLSTFDTDTRARLAILLNEAGTAFAGRKMDYKTFLTDFAPSLNLGTDLLQQFTQDNQALGNLLDASDSYIKVLADNRVDVADTLDKFGQTFETVAAKRAELRATIAKAPGGLAAANDFLEQFDQISAPLNDATIQVARAAPAITDLLDNVHLFTDATAPILADFPDVGASVEYLSDNSTRILERLQPVVGDLRSTIQNRLPAVTDTVDKSIDNTIATTVNWAGAIGYQDGMGHVFRGEVGLGPETFVSMLRGLGVNLDLTDALARKGAKPRQAPQQTAGAPAAPKPNAPQSILPEGPLKKPLDDVNNLLGQVLGNTGQTVQQLQKTLGNLGINPDGTLDLNKLGNLGKSGSEAPAAPLLDFLLGK